MVDVDIFSFIHDNTFIIRHENDCWTGTSQRVNSRPVTNERVRHLNLMKEVTGTKRCGGSNLSLNALSLGEA